jgi:uracil-DNA glycosylase
MSYINEASWSNALKEEFENDSFIRLMNAVEQEYAQNTVFPPKELLFSAFELCPLSQLKVVILGQDPYHSKGLAHGLSFSVKNQPKLPPSLRNIYKELLADVGSNKFSIGDLSHWATQGVLLLNAMLSVEEAMPASHQQLGWENFTNHVISLISVQKEHVVFVLWGAFAQDKKNLIDSTKHLVICSPHPSPFSAHKGFFGSKPFSKTNNYLTHHGLAPIDWG